MSLKSKFCAKCGKVTESLLGGLCPACYLYENPIKVQTSLTLKVCPKCDAVLWRGVWLRSEKQPEYYFKELIKSKLRPPKNTELRSIDVIELGKLGSVSIQLKVLDELIEKKFEVKLEINKFACPDCSRQKADWTAKLQVRGLSVKDEQPTGKCTKEGRTLTVNDVLAMASKHRAKTVKTEQKKNGLDMYFFTRSAANKLANKLKKQFGLAIKKSHEQHGHDFDTGKPKYREIISVR